MNDKRSGWQVEGDSRGGSCKRPALADRIADRLGSEPIPGQMMIAANDQGAKTPRAGPPAGEVLKPRIAGFLSDFSIETIPTSRREITSYRADLEPGTCVYVVSPPTRSLGDICDTARYLHENGLQPVPHIAARSISDRDCLADFLRQITSQAGVNQVLVIGGSRPKPVGDFDNSLQILQTGLLEEFGIRRIGLAGHPEGHPVVPRDRLLDDLRKKIAWARRAGAETYLVTQFCFDPGIVTAWERDIRATVVGIPVHVGLPGPASLTSLLKYARICGIGESVRFLTRGAGSALKLATWTPDRFLTALANHKAVDPECRIGKAHFYSFGGVTRTARWLAAVRNNAIELSRDGSGFAVVPSRSSDPG